MAVTSEKMHHVARTVMTMMKIVMCEGCGDPERLELATEHHG